MSKFRTESDSIGQIEVPNEKFWGAQTQRSLENFPIGNDKICKRMRKEYQKIVSNSKKNKKY